MHSILIKYLKHGCLKYVDKAHSQNIDDGNLCFNFGSFGIMDITFFGNFFSIPFYSRILNQDNVH